MEEKKKLYAAPQMEAYQVKPASIISTSDSLKQDEASFEGYKDGGKIIWD